MTSEKASKEFDLTGIGNACMDIVANCDMDFISRHHVDKSHCIYVDFPSLQNLKSELVSPELIAGGAAANTIYVFQCLGGQTAFLGKIAEDMEGRAFQKSMEDIGIATYLNVDPQSEVGSTQVVSLRTPDGDRSFVTYQGVAETIAPDDLDYSVVAESKIVYFDGYTMYSPFALEAFLRSAATAHQNGGLAVFNPGDLSIVELYKEKVATLIDQVDMVICNLAEARSIFGANSLKEAAEKIPLIHKIGVVTDGANGAMVFKDNEIIFMPPPARPNGEIYTLGAGDHFSAGFLYGLTHNFTLSQSARLAELCALDCIQHPGARPLGSLKHLIEEALQI